MEPYKSKTEPGNNNKPGFTTRRIFSTRSDLENGKWKRVQLLGACKPYRFPKSRGLHIQKYQVTLSLSVLSLQSSTSLISLSCLKSALFALLAAHFIPKVTVNAM